MIKSKITATEELKELEKLTKKVIRKSLKDNTLDFTCQITRSSIDPGKTKYATLITSPSYAVQPISFIFDSYEMLRAALEHAEKEINKKQVELTFHESRITTYKNKIQQHEERMKQLNDPEYKEEEEIEMEEV